MLKGTLASPQAIAGWGSVGPLLQALPRDALGFWGSGVYWWSGSEGALRIQIAASSCGDELAIDCALQSLLLRCIAASSWEYELAIDGALQSGAQHSSPAIGVNSLFSLLPT